MKTLIFVLLSVLSVSVFSDNSPFTSTMAFGHMVPGQVIRVKSDNDVIGQAIAERLFHDLMEDDIPVGFIGPKDSNIAWVYGYHQERASYSKSVPVSTGSLVNRIFTDLQVKVIVIHAETETLMSESQLSVFLQKGGTVIVFDINDNENILSKHNNKRNIHLTSHFTDDSFHVALHRVVMGSEMDLNISWLLCGSRACSIDHYYAIGQ